MRKTLCIISLLWVTLLLIGCLESTGTDSVRTAEFGEHRSLADTSANQTALNYYEWEYSNFDEYQRPFYYDVDFWSQDHADEIVKTLEVADVMYADDLALALIRFSVGSDVFREAIWLRKYRGNWTVSSSQYFSTFSDDPFGDGDTDRAKEMIEKEEAWKENSADKF